MKPDDGFQIPWPKFRGMRRFTPVVRFQAFFWVFGQPNIALCRIVDAADDVDVPHVRNAIRNRPPSQATGDTLRSSLRQKGGLPPVAPSAAGIEPPLPAWKESSIGWQFSATVNPLKERCYEEPTICCNESPGIWRQIARICEYKTRNIWALKPNLRWRMQHYILAGNEERIHRNIHRKLPDGSTKPGRKSRRLAAAHRSMVGAGETEVRVVHIGARSG